MADKCLIGGMAYATDLKSVGSNPFPVRVWDQAQNIMKNLITLTENSKIIISSDRILHFLWNTINLQYSAPEKVSITFLKKGQEVSYEFHKGKYNIPNGNTLTCNSKRLTDTKFMQCFKNWITD